MKKITIISEEAVSFVQILGWGSLLIVAFALTVSFVGQRPEVMSVESGNEQALEAKNVRVKSDSQGGVEVRYQGREGRAIISNRNNVELVAVMAGWDDDFWVAKIDGLVAGERYYLDLRDLQGGVMGRYHFVVRAR